MPRSTTRPQGTHYIPTLDGWRAIAILWVMVVHTAPQQIGPFSTASLGVLDGVDLFFALSGFLICTRLLREEAAVGSISLRSFYLRRLFRIQPAALTYLAILSLLGLFHIVQIRWSSVATAALMVRNFYPPVTRLYPEWYTGHFWSLAVEEHFYLLFPAFLLCVRRRRLTVLSFIVGVVELWHWIVYTHPSLQGGAMVLNFRTDMAIMYILIGSVFAVALQHARIKQFAQRHLHLWVASLFTAAVLTSVSLHHSRANQALYVPVYPLLIVATVLHSNSPFSRFLSLPPLRFLGRISFSLYLWQQLFTGVQPEPGTYRTHILFCWLAAFACAIASYYLIERPLIRLGHRLTASPILSTPTHP